MRRGLSGASVPKILLSLGALCLLVAAVIFLAVAWSWLGVGGRTVVLVGLTVVAAGAAGWLARRGLRIGAEALAVVAFGLVTLDLVGADDAGWFGDLTGSGLLTVIGLTVGGLGLAATWLTARSGRLVLLAPQAFAALGLGVVPIGVSDLTDSHASVFAVSSAAFLALAVVTHRLSIGRLDWLFAALTGCWWLVLASEAMSRLIEHSTWSELWVDLHVWPAVAAATLLLVGAWVVRTRTVAASALAGLGATVLTVAVAAPSLAAATDQAALTMLAFVAGWSVALLVAPERWRWVPTIPLVTSAVVPLLIVVPMVATVLESLLDSGTPWHSPAGVRLVSPVTEGHPLLLLSTAAVGCLATVALSRLFTDPRRFALDGAPFLAAAVALAAVLSLAAYDVPLALVLAGLVVIAAGLVAWALPRRDLRGAAGLAVALVVALVALVAALPSVVLTLLVALVLVGGGALVALRGADDIRRAAGAAVVPPAVALAVWAVADLSGLDVSWRGVPVLLVVGGLAIWRPRPEVEFPAAAAGFIASVGAVPMAFDQSEAQGLVCLAVYLTVAGALVTASALVHPERRWLGYPGGLLLAMATWVRLYDLGVTAPEAYTLPSAVALGVLGLYRLRRDPDASTSTALMPALVLATVPSLLWVMAEDATSWRALLLGMGCLALVLGGTRLRWNAPLLVGAVVGALLVLTEVGPYAAELPSWVVIALAGTLLTVRGGDLGEPAAEPARRHGVRRQAAMRGEGEGRGAY